MQSSMANCPSTKLLENKGFRPRGNKPGKLTGYVVVEIFRQIFYICSWRRKSRLKARIICRFPC